MHLLFDFHTHTQYSHGKGTIEDNVKVALDKGLKAIAITDHGPGHITYGVRRDKIKQMRREIETLQKKYNNQIEIKLGVEANIIHAEGMLDLNEDEKGAFDVILAGYHYGVFGKHFIRAGAIHMVNYLSTKTGKTIEGIKHMNTEAIIRAVYSNPISILTHPGAKAFVDIREIAKACAETDTMMEINNSHGHLTVEEIEEAAQENVKFVISSDAHRPEHVGEFSKSLSRVLKAGLPIKRIVNISGK